MAHCHIIRILGKSLRDIFKSLVVKNEVIFKFCSLYRVSSTFKRLS
jgi:hypothetical protein